MSEFQIIRRKGISRITISIPIEIERRLRLYQASMIVEESKHTSFSKIISKLLLESLERHSSSIDEMKLLR